MEMTNEHPTLQIKTPKAVNAVITIRPPRNQKQTDFKPAGQEGHPQKPYRIWSQQHLQNYLARFEDIIDVEFELDKIQDMLRYFEGPSGQKEKKEDLHKYTENVKRATQLFRALLWQKTNWPNQQLPPNWLGIGGFSG